MTDATDLPAWAKLAEDPSAITWDDEAKANLQKLIDDYKRVTELLEESHARQERYGNRIYEVEEQLSGAMKRLSEIGPKLEGQLYAAEGAGGQGHMLYFWSDGVVTWKKER